MEILEKIFAASETPLATIAQARRIAREFVSLSYLACVRDWPSRTLAELLQLQKQSASACAMAQAVTDCFVAVGYVARAPFGSFSAAPGWLAPYVETLAAHGCIELSRALKVDKDQTHGAWVIAAVGIDSQFIRHSEPRIDLVMLLVQTTQWPLLVEPCSEAAIAIAGILLYGFLLLEPGAFSRDDMSATLSAAGETAGHAREVVRVAFRCACDTGMLAVLQEICAQVPAGVLCETRRLKCLSPKTVEWLIRHQLSAVSTDQLRKYLERAIKRKQIPAIQFLAKRVPEVFVAVLTSGSDSCCEKKHVMLQDFVVGRGGSLNLRADCVRKIVQVMEGRLKNLSKFVPMWLTRVSKRPELALEFPRVFIWPRVAGQRFGLREVCAEYKLGLGAPGCQAPRWLLPRWLLQHATAQEAELVKAEFAAELAEVPAAAVAWTPRAKLAASDYIGNNERSMSRVKPAAKKTSAQMKKFREHLPSILVAASATVPTILARLIAAERDRCGLLAQFIECVRKKTFPAVSNKTPTVDILYAHAVVDYLLADSVLDDREAVTVFRTWSSLVSSWAPPPARLAARVAFGVSQGARDQMIRRMARQSSTRALEAAFAANVRVSATCAEALANGLIGRDTRALTQFVDNPAAL